MDTPTPRRPDDRARALRRLRTMTIGTALAGVAATGAFGWLAATTNPGSSATLASVDTTSAASTSSASSSTDAAATASPTTSTTTGSSSTSVSSSSGSGQVSTGGS